MTLKKKRSSLVIAIVNIILSGVIFCLYSLSLFNEAGNSLNLAFSNTFLTFVKSNLFNFNFSNVDTYLVLIAFYLPFFFCLFGLFGYFARFANIFPLIAFCFSFISYFSFATILTDNSVRAFLNFSTSYNSLFSTIFFVDLLGLILSFINLEKSK